MDIKYLNPFITSVQNVFDTMLNVPFKLGKPYIKEDKTPLYEVSGLIGLSGIVKGMVVINLSKNIALQLSSALIGEEVTELDEDCTDAVGEIANMITGGAKKDFPGEHNSISVPSVVLGKHKLVYPTGVPIIAVPCDTSAGRLVIELALKVTEEAKKAPVDQNDPTLVESGA